METYNGILYLIQLCNSITLHRCTDYRIFINFNAIAHCYGIDQSNIIS